MWIEPRTVVLKNGQTAVLRSPKTEDAKAVLDCIRQISEETHFMARYPEEIRTTEEEEESRLKEILQARDNFMLGAFLPTGNEPDVQNMFSLMDGELAGVVGVGRMHEIFKLRHRAALDIFLKKDYCNMGLGSMMLQEALEIAKNTEFEQVELAVFSDNRRARYVYEKMGFRQAGIVPKACKLKDGSYLDEILMVYMLR